MEKLRGLRIRYVWRRGVGGLTRFVLRGQKIGCHSVVGLAQPPSDHAGGGERRSWKFDDCVVWLIAWYVPRYVAFIWKRFLMFNIFAVFPKLSITFVKSPMMKLLSGVTNHNSYESFSAHISIQRSHKALAQYTSVLVCSSFCYWWWDGWKGRRVFSKSGSAQRWRFIDMAGDIKSVIFIMLYRG